MRCISDMRASGFSSVTISPDRLADRHTIAVRGAHHDALDHGLPADQRFLAAFEDGHHLNVREKTKKGAQGHNSSQSELLL